VTVQRSEAPTDSRARFAPRCSGQERLFAMAVTTKDDSHGSYFNGYRLSSWALHAASWLTTYWLCTWVGEPKTNEGYAVVVVISLVLEFFVLHKMKKLLFDAKKSNDGIGWAGFIIDSFINLGGALPKMGRLAAWPPLAALAGTLGVDTTKGMGNTIAGFLIALIIGIILSIAPIRLAQVADEH
jgi:hypothetical protein